MPIELILFPKRSAMRALRVGADKRCDMDVGKMSLQSAWAFECGLRDAFWPRALTRTSPLRKYLAYIHVATGAGTRYPARPVSVHIKKKSYEDWLWSSCIGWKIATSASEGAQSMGSWRGGWFRASSPKTSEGPASSQGKWKSAPYCGICVSRGARLGVENPLSKPSFKHSSKNGLNSEDMPRLVRSPCCR